MSYQIPLICPSCKSTLTFEGVNLYCHNTRCPDQVTQRLQHSVGKSALDWDGFGPAQVDALVTKCGCYHFSDVLALDRATISTVLGPGQTAKFIAERERIKTAPLWRKLVALGIELVGRTACKDLCAKYTSLEDIIAAGPAALRSMLGPVAAKNFVDYIESTVDELDRCAQYGYTFEEPLVDTTASVPRKLAGLTFCITGSLTSGTRTAVQNTIEAAGGSIKGVSRKLDYLVVGVGGGAKEDTAKKLGVKCITEEELYTMLGQPMPIAAMLPSDEL